MDQLDDRLGAIFKEAAKRLGVPPEPPPKKTGRPRGTNYKPRPQKLSQQTDKPALASDEAAALKSLILEGLRRKIDGLRLYRPMPLQQSFHECHCREKLARGANRSGKSTMAAVEVARAVTGKDERYPETGIAYLVGKDGREVANVMYKLLFRAGSFKMIRDLETGEWRSYNPTDPADLARKKQAKPVPPLIPPRFVKFTAWEDKKKGVPAVVVLHNGWELHFFSSNALPPHGSQIDLAWFDEEILNQGWYSEIAARLVDREGRFVWSATPQAGTIQLLELHERAEDQLRLPYEDRTIMEFHVTLADNCHLTDKQKAEFMSKLSEEDVLVRVYGEFASHGLRVWPEFSEKKIICSYFDIPPHWTNYVAIDPGRQVCGVLFLAVPPPEEDQHVYLWDELYIRMCSASIFGQQMGLKCRGKTLEVMLIDHQEGRKVETGYGKSIEEQYSAALESNRVSCNATGLNFTPGAADPQGGVEAVRHWLVPQGQETAKLKILEGKCPNLIWEIKRYWYQTDADKRVTDKPRDRGPVHLCACLRYLVQYDPVYVSPVEAKPKPGEIWKAAHELKTQGKGKQALNLGPGSFSIGVGV